MMRNLDSATRNIRVALGVIDLSATLGWQDIKQRYRRSRIGPFWLTISMGVMIGVLGLVFGSVFNSTMPEFLPFLTAGLILWTFYSTLINEGCLAFIQSDSMIKQLPLPLFVHVMRVIWRNLIILAHNLVILPIVFIVFMKPVSPVMLLFIPGLILSTLAISSMALIAGILCTRFRDLTPIIASSLQVVFYITPILWMPSLLSGQKAFFLLDSNPFYHLVEIVRAPLLGYVPSTSNWVLSLGTAVFGWGIALLLYARFKYRISYWL